MSEISNFQKITVKMIYKINQRKNIWLIPNKHINKNKTIKILNNLKPVLLNKTKKRTCFLPIQD